MQLKHIPPIRTIAILVLIGLVTLQFVGLRKAYTLQSALDEENIQLSLRNLTQQISRDTLVLHPEKLQQAAKQTFQKHFEDSLRNDDFRLLIFEQDQRSVLYSNHKHTNVSIRSYPYKESGYFSALGHDVQILLKLEKQNNAIPSFLLIWGLLSLLFIALLSLAFFYSIRSNIKHRQLNKIKNDFINNMSHELKTPIATMSVASEMLVKKEIYKDDTKLNRYAHIIQSETKRLHRLVEQVLKTAIFENQSQQFESEECNFHVIINRSVDVFLPLIESKNGKIEFDLAAKNPIVIGDPTHLNQVISNLIDNAIKYSADKPFIRISTHNNPKALVIDISDCGIGISKKEKERIFEKFHRVSTENLHDQKGFGVGLYYVKQVVDRHNGTVSVQSKIGEGSTFSIRFPFLNRKE